MATTTETATDTARFAGLWDRRQALCDIHSYLRSVDNLRPDEALDELAKLYEAWSLERSFDSRACSGWLDENSRLSHQARGGAVARLEPLVSAFEAGHAGDLFQELADVGVRMGMGQYFTPRPVADAMAQFLRPQGGEAWLDPFCGSSLLLGAIARASSAPITLYGIDRDLRVLHLSRVEAALEHPESPLRLVQANALAPTGDLLVQLDAPEAGFDGVVANPPFGAEVHASDRDAYDRFELATGSGASSLEILGLEQCIRFLRPGGRLGIVLPQSVLSNRSHRVVREFVAAHCDVNGVIGLAGDTFLPFRGVSKASLLFLTKRPATRQSRTVAMLGISRDIGWDATGRQKGECDLPALVEAMLGRRHSADVGELPADADIGRNLTAEWLLRPTIEGIRLGDLLEVAFNGRSPGRAAYESEDSPADSQYRIVKVADLTGTGIDWTPGERSVAEFKRRPASKYVQIGDIITTAAAHHPRYIGLKVDVVDVLPEGMEDRTIASAEVMVLRANPDKIDPYVLLLWLRSRDGRAALQSCVTGQTAHLRPDDVLDVVVPEELVRSPATWIDAVRQLKESLALRRESENAARGATASFTSALAEPAG